MSSCGSKSEHQVERQVGLRCAVTWVSCFGSVALKRMDHDLHELHARHAGAVFGAGCNIKSRKGQSVVQGQENQNVVAETTRGRIWRGVCTQQTLASAVPLRYAILDNNTQEHGRCCNAPGHQAYQHQPWLRIEHQEFPLVSLHQWGTL